MSSQSSGTLTQGAPGALRSLADWFSSTSARYLLALPAALFLIVFFVIPIARSALASFSGGEGAGAFFSVLIDPFYIKVTLQTLGLSLVVAVASLLFGYPIAYFLVRYSGRWSSLIIFLLIAPLLTSIIMRTFGWRVLFARGGIVNDFLMDIGLIDRPLQLLNNPIAVVIGLVHVLSPFMVLSIASSLRGINRRIEESAYILGAGPLTTFFRITVPLSREGIGTGMILVFMIANGSFVSTLMLGGGSIQTLPLLIYQQFMSTIDRSMSAAMSNILLMLALICLYVQLRLLRAPGEKT